MGFTDLNLKKEYRSLIDNVIRDFYIPLLNNSVSYQRAVGFFSSSSLIDISKGITGLIKNNGTIKLVASPYLHSDDIEAIKKGYEERNKIIESALINELLPPKNYFETERLNLIAHLIAQKKLEIKIALTDYHNNIGMYHEKMGIFTDKHGYVVAFSGSMNESSSAFSNNYEAIDVFCSWENEMESGRANNKKKVFEKIWNNEEENISVIEFPRLKEEILNKYKYADPNFTIDFEEFDGEKINVQSKKGKDFPEIPESVTLYDYQLEAINSWEKQNFRGIYDMATGTGKTFTGLASIVKLANFENYKLGVFIVCPFQHLVEQWVDDLRFFNFDPIVGYSASSQRDWKSRLENAIRDQKLHVKNKQFFCFICTNATYSSEFVQSQIQKMSNNALLVVDEAHNFGADRLSSLLSERFKFRLALSATIERFNDQSGTEKLLEYFGEKCIVYSLEDAIKNKKLTPYKYFPIIVTLNGHEWDEYKIISKKISKCMIKDNDGNSKLSHKGNLLAIKRARIVAAAEQKIDKLEEVISPYLNRTHILVYCGAASLLFESEYDTIPDSDLRQIDIVTDLLGNKLGMKVSQFTSKEDINTRIRLKSEFEIGDHLQALIAIKCLDEGVNIPKIKVAFILASTTNPKEYIQRRGRVLRIAQGKHFAEIYDFITLPPNINEVQNLTQQQIEYDYTLVKKEIVRAEEFARIAMNSFEAGNLINDLKKAYGLFGDYYSFNDCD